MKFMIEIKEIELFLKELFNDNNIQIIYIYINYIKIIELLN